MPPNASEENAEAAHGTGRRSVGAALPERDVLDAVAVHVADEAGGPGAESAGDVGAQLTNGDFVDRSGACGHPSAAVHQPGASCRARGAGRSDDEVAHTVAGHVLASVECGAKVLPRRFREQGGCAFEGAARPAVDAVQRPRVLTQRRVQLCADRDVGAPVAIEVTQRGNAPAQPFPSRQPAHDDDP